MHETCSGGYAEETRSDTLWIILFLIFPLTYSYKREQLLHSDRVAAAEEIWVTSPLSPCLSITRDQNL